MCVIVLYWWWWWRGEWHRVRAGKCLSANMGVCLNAACTTCGSWAPALKPRPAEPAPLQCHSCNGALKPSPWLCCRPFPGQRLMGSSCPPALNAWSSSTRGARCSGVGITGAPRLGSGGCCRWPAWRPLVVCRPCPFQSNRCLISVPGHVRLRHAAPQIQPEPRAAVAPGGVAVPSAQRAPSHWELPLCAPPGAQPQALVPVLPPDAVCWARSTCWQH